MMTIFRVLGSLTSIYMLLCFVRVVLTWVDGASLGRPYELLKSATDPYIDWFRRFPALKTGTADFSSVAALATLALAGNIFVTIGNFGRITVGILLSLVLSGAWSAVAFLFFFFTAILAIRLVSLLSGWQPSLPIWRVLDSIANPVLYRINRFIYRDRLVSYQRGMGTAIAVLLGARIIGGIAVGIVSGLFVRLPF